MDMKLWIDGKWTDPAAGTTFEVENPATGMPVAVVAKAGAADVDKAVAAAKQAFDDGRWSGLTPAQRAQPLLKLADLLEARMADFARVESEDSGKPYQFQCMGADLPFGVDNLRFFAAAARETSGRHAGEFLTGYTSIYRREPVGVVGQIAPWNYPLLMAIWKLGPALAAGCTVVLKPATLTPRTSLMLGQLTAEAGFPDGVVNVLAGNIGQAIVAHPNILFFNDTATTETGRSVMTGAAGTLKRVHLELGGKAPVLVFGDADVALVAEKASLAAWCNAGQDCTAATRVICHESIAPVVREALVEAMRAVKVGDPFDVATQMGPMISARQRETVLGFVQRAQAEGATVLTGGKSIDGPGYYVQPTIISNVAQDAEIVQQEVFGPVLTIQTFSSEAEAVAMGNDVVFGLAASVFTRDVARAMRVTRALQFGTVWVNDHLPIASETPHGGFKQSGFGKDLQKGGQAIEQSAGSQSSY